MQPRTPYRNTYAFLLANFCRIGPRKHHIPHDVSSVIGSSLKTSSRPLVGVVGDDGVAGGVVGTCRSFRFSGPFFSWLLELFFILASTRSRRDRPQLASAYHQRLRCRLSDLNRGSRGSDVPPLSSRFLASLFRSVRLTGPAPNPLFLSFPTAPRVLITLPFTLRSRVRHVSTRSRPDNTHTGCKSDRGVECGLRASGPTIYPTGTLDGDDGKS